jgi:hypothetical protein
MIRLCALATTLALGLVPASYADEAPPIEKLVEQLGSGSFPARERAMKLLRDRGPAALPALRKALDSKDEEVRKRAEALIPPLEIEEALLPKRVTLAKVDSALTALDAINKQTGYKVTFDGKVPVNLKEPINVADVSFWDTIDQLGKRAGARPFANTEGSVYLQTSGTGSPFTNLRGPFRLEATWFHEDRDLAFDRGGPGGVRNHRLTLSVSVLAEPRLTFLKVGPARVEEALDSDGKSLLEATPPAPEPPLTKGGAARKARAAPRPASDMAAPGRGQFRGESTWFSDVRLRRASETAKTAKVIRGAIPVKTVLIRRPVIVTTKLMESTGTSFRAGQESLQITRIENQGGGSIQVQLQIPYDRNMDWSQVEKWYHRFHVEDDAGHRFQDHGRGSQSNGMQYHISMYYGPPNGKAVGPPTKLIFEDWVVHDHEIPFEFRDVPLP